jgi:hypothetical protein
MEKSHLWDLGFVPSLFQLVMFGWITWDRVGPLGGKWGTVGWEGHGVVLASQHLQGCIPHLCQLTIDGLAPVSRYWTYRSHVSDMGPVSLVACCRHMFSFHYYINGCDGRETGWRTYRSLGRAGGCVGGPFLGSSRVRPTLLMACKKLPRMGTAHRKCMPGVRGLS